MLARADEDWSASATCSARPAAPAVRHNHALLTLPCAPADAQARAEEHRPDLRVMSAGEVIEIYKETGRPERFAELFALGDVRGTHAIGHTRMATESKVTTEGSHPFSTGEDLCLVHNGSLSNHNRLRENLRSEGIRFVSENDTEVAAGYLAWRLREGASLQEALEGCLDDLDGFYTFAVGTRDGFAVMRDPIACKPAVMAETDDWVAMASEYRAIAVLPGRRRRALLGARAGARLRLGAGARGVSAAAETFDLAATPLRALNQHLHDLAGTSGGARARRPTRAARTPSPAASTPSSRSTSTARGLLLRRHEQARDRARARQRGLGPGREHDERARRRRRQRQPVLRRHGARRAASSSAATHPALRHLDEGRRDRRARLGRRQLDVHGAVGRARRLRRRGRGARRLDLRGAHLRARSGRALGADCVEKELRDEHVQQLGALLERAGADDAEPSQFRRYGSARRLYNFDVDNAGAYGLGGEVDQGRLDPPARLAPGCASVPSTAT